LLHHVTDLEQQASRVQEPVQARIDLGTELDKPETKAAEKQTKALVEQANTDADQADKIAVGVASGGTPEPVPGGADVDVPGAVAGNASGGASGAVVGNGSVDIPGSVVGSAVGNAAANAAGNALGGDPALVPDPEALWFKKLQNGLLHYVVPANMDWKVPSTITVTIDGERASAAPLAGETGQGAIKVARIMMVEPSCPDNPDEFTFTAEPGTTPRQYVSADGSTTWQWSVMPRYTGVQQKIKIQAWVVYSDKDGIMRELPVYGTAVDVHVPGFREFVKRLVEPDPDYWIHYGLPGGAGFIFVSGAFVGIWRRWSNRK